MRLFNHFYLPLALVSLSFSNQALASSPSGDCLAPQRPCAPVVVREPKPEGPNWIFQPGNYSHDPRTGERTTQYAPLPAIEAFSDTRAIASGYHRSRVNQYGAGGSVDTYYRVENWGNGRGGIDAEWERVNDVWQQSTMSGGWGQGSGRPGGGWNGGWPGNGWNGNGWNGGGGNGGWPGNGWNGGGWNGGGPGNGWNGGGWNGGGPGNGWNGGGWNGGGFPGGGGPQGF